MPVPVFKLKVIFAPNANVYGADAAELLLPAASVATPASTETESKPAKFGVPVPFVNVTV